MTKFRHVQRGDPLNIPAATYNAIVDAAAAHAAKGRGFGAGVSNAIGSPAVVLVKNASGADIPRFGVLGIDGVVFTPSDNRDGFLTAPCLRGITPADPDHRGKFVIVQEPVANGAIGVAYLAGLSVVNVNVVTAGDPLAEIAGGSVSQLTSGPDGSAQILYAESGTGTKLAVIRFGSSGGPGDGKVKVDSSDTLDYLEDQFVDKTASAFVANTDVVVRANNVGGGDPQLKLYAALDTISGYSPGGTQVLVNESGVLKWVDVTKDKVITDYNLNGNAFQVKEQDAYLIGTESDWITRHLGTTC